MRVLICDDQAMIRDGLVMLLGLEGDVEVVGIAEDGLAAVELAAQLSPDVVLMDLKMPRMNGVEATRLIRSQRPQVKVLVLTTYDNDTWLFEAIRVGAAGYILKDSPRADLVRALRETVGGKGYIDPGIAAKVLGKLSADHGQPQARPATAISGKLSERELEILGLIARGLSNAIIAERLHLTDGTVRNHVSAILAKLNLTDRTQAALLAVQHGLGEG